MVTALRFEGAEGSAAVTGAGDIVARENATTNLYLMPGSTFHVVDALITNFHVPRSTLVMLVSAFATRDQVIAAYEEAVRERYRFFSFGASCGHIELFSDRQPAVREDEE